MSLGLIAKQLLPESLHPQLLRGPPCSATPADGLDDSEGSLLLEPTGIARIMPTEVHVILRLRKTCHKQADPALQVLTHTEAQFLSELQRKNPMWYQQKALRRDEET